VVTKVEKLSKGCHISTSMTSNQFENTGLREPPKFAYKEGHFIPGVRYAGTKINENEGSNLKSVVLK